MAGILVYQQIRALIESGALTSTPAIAPAQIQPSSLDLRLATRGYRVRSGFLPEHVRVADRLEEMTLYTFDLTDGAVLEKGHCYIVPLLERIERPLPFLIRANPKSSTGRLDMFTRLLADRCGRFETVPAGYTGPLFLEIVPRSFPVRVRTGLSLCQIRFSEGEAELTDAELRAEYARSPLLFDDRGRALPLDRVRFDRGLCMGVAMRKDRDVPGPIGYLARRYAGVVDTALEGQHDAALFFEPIEEAADGRLIVDEIYLGLSYDGPPRSVLASTLDHADDLFVISSFSKYFNMTGWRLGWLVVPLMEAMAPSAMSTPASAASRIEAELMPLVSCVWK